MSLKILLLRGTTEQNNQYVGKNGELTIDVTTRSLRIHDGTTAGGHAVLGNQQVQTLIDGLSDRIDSNDADILTINGDIGDINAALETKFDKASVGVAGGAASLNAEGKVPLSELSDAVLGQVIYQGTWDAATNTPTLPMVPENKGDYYVASSTGTFEGIEYETGDWIISNGTAWEKVNNTDAVRTVAGRKGDVVLNKSDVGLDQVDNTSDVNKPVSTAQQSALDSVQSTLQTNIDTKVNQTEYDQFKADVEALDTGVSTVTGAGAITVDSTNAANPVVGIDNATPTTDGAMSAADKTKMDTVEDGAQVNTVTGVAGRTGDVVLDKSDVNLENVENYAVASTIEAEAGDTNTKYATPLAVRGFVEGMGFAQDAQSGEWTLDQGSM